MSGGYVGKYRGTVTNDRDPQHLGRIRANVPEVLGDAESGWALPCAPCGGIAAFAVPSVGASVWIEFEQGELDFPIWSGCWWDTPGEIPPAAPGRVMLRTAEGHAIVIDDAPGGGGITLEAASGERIRLTSRGIDIDNGKGARIELSGPQVSINGDALEVT